MSFGIITSTSNTFGSVDGTTNCIIPGTLSGSVGVPGPAGAPGVGVPAGGLTGQILSKASNTSYDTAWTTISLAGYATESWVTAGFLSKAGNLSGLTDLSMARDNLQLGTLNSPTFAGVTVQGAGSNVANLGATFLTLNHTGYGQFTIQPSSGITFPDTTVQTTAFNASVLLPYAPLNSPLFTGDPRGPTAALGDNDTSLATTAFVQQELASGTAVAKNLEVYVRNQTGSTLAAGTIVYINGATGNRPTVTPAQANNDANSAQTMGFVKTAIANNGFGYVIVRGEVENLDTSALTEGVQLYLSPTTPGAWTTSKPTAPQHLVYVGIVIRAHSTQGVILVAVQNGYELNELHDVAISSPTNGQVLKYDSATNLWKNQTDSSGVAWGGITGTITSQTDLMGQLNLKANLSGATFTGKVNFTPISGVAGLNVGVGGTSAASTTAGDIWITTGGANLNFRDGTGAWRICAITTSTNTFSSPQIIDTTNASAALRVTQKGTGNAIEVEDSTTPDATRFTVDQFGKVGIGVAPDTLAALNVDANGIKAYGAGGLEVLVNSANGVNVSDLGGNVTNLSAGYVTLYAAIPGQGGIYFSDGSLQSTAAVSGISDAPSDGVVYGRQNASWVSTDSLYYSSGNPSGYIPDAPSDGNYYVRQNGNWVACTVVSIYDSNTSTSYNCLTV